MTDARRSRRRTLLVSGGWLLLLLALALANGYGESPTDALITFILGGLGGMLLQRAVLEMRERLRFADLPAPLRAHQGRWITVILLALLSLALWGLAGVPNILRFFASGAVVTLVVKLLRRAGQELQPRYQVSIANDGRILQLPKGTSLLESLRSQGYDLFAQCGGQGQCATCRVRVLRGPANWGPLQRGSLTPALLQQNYVLACQLQVESDLTIELFGPLVLAWPTLDGGPAPRERRLIATGLPQLSSRARPLRHHLPGFNCGACGYATCDGYAQALAEGQANLECCLPGGQPVRARLQYEAERLQLAQVSQQNA